MARILFVDDDALTRDHVSELLKSAGHDVVQAQNGAEGLEKFERERPDLVIMDIIMPGEPGVETIAKIRRLHGGVPILAVSSGGPEASGLFLQLAEGVGASRTLRKPLREDELLREVGLCLEGATEHPDRSL